MIFSYDAFLCLPDMAAERLTLLKESLQGEGFSCWDASIGVEGIKIRKGMYVNKGS